MKHMKALITILILPGMVIVGWWTLETRLDARHVLAGKFDIYIEQSDQRAKQAEQQIKALHKTNRQTEIRLLRKGIWDL